MQRQRLPGRVAVLIPALNEEEALPGVLQRLPRADLEHVLVVDNGSTDRTIQVARAHGTVVLREEERGYGAACLAGIRYLGEMTPPPTALAFVDADATAELPHLHRLVSPILADSADLVLGVREDSEGRRGNLHLHARAGNRLILALARLLFDVRTPDLPPFRAIRFSSLTELEMDDRNWGWTLQMQIRARRRGLRIRQIRVPHRPRGVGESKISGDLGTSVRVGAKMVYTLARERLRPGP